MRGAEHIGIILPHPLSHGLARLAGKFPIYQWPFQEPKLEVPTIYKAYGSGLCKGISPENMALYGTVPPF